METPMETLHWRDSPLESEALQEIIHIMGGSAATSNNIYVLHFYFFHCGSTHSGILRFQY